MKKPIIQKKQFFELINQIIQKNITLYICIVIVKLKYYFLVNRVQTQNNFLHVT